MTVHQHHAKFPRVELGEPFRCPHPLGPSSEFLWRFYGLLVGRHDQSSLTSSMCFVDVESSCPRNLNPPTGTEITLAGGFSVRWSNGYQAARRNCLSPVTALVWENTRLLRAKNREEAYEQGDKVVPHCTPTKNKCGEWHFAGISMLLPVYEEIEDGAELLWNDRGLMTIGRIRSWLKPKSNFPCLTTRNEQCHLFIVEGDVQRCSMVQHLFCTNQVHFLRASALVQQQHTLGAAAPTALPAALIYSFIW